LHIRQYKFRIGLVTLIFIMLLILITFRLAYIHLAFHEKAVGIAQAQHSVRIELEPRRGAILDRNMRKLALNLKVDSVYAVARDVSEKEAIAKLLAPIIGKDESFLYERLKRDKLFVWLARKISSADAEKVKELNLKGIHLIDETKRFYPGESLASQVIGFAGTDNTGLEGVEAFYNRYMYGKKGYKTIARDAKGREIHAFEGDYIPPIDGYSVVLTLDEVIQHITEKALRKAYEKHKAKAAVALVMDPYKGDILALAVLPSFDLNNFNYATDDAKRNRAIADYYEPGSVFKIIAASACLDTGAVSIEDNFFCENGAWYVAGHTLHDTHGHGDMTFREVIEKSSNIGTVKAAMRLGEEDLYKYIKAYGFGVSTGIGLPGEINGIVRPVDQWSKYSITSIPMGQEVGVTPLQLIMSLSAIANGGQLVKPRIVNSVIDSKGEIIKKYEPSIVRRVTSEETSRQMREIMKGVIEHGTGTRAKLNKFDAGGKTGTAQKVEPSGRYSHRDYIASFAGFAPAEKPIIAVCVMVDTPRNGYYGGTVSGPVFKEICDATLRYLDIEQETHDEA